LLCTKQKKTVIFSSDKLNHLSLATKLADLNMYSTGSEEIIVAEPVW